MRRVLTRRETITQRMKGKEREGKGGHAPRRDGRGGRRACRPRDQPSTLERNNAPSLKILSMSEFSRSQAQYRSNLSVDGF